MTEPLDLLRFAAVASSMVISTGCTAAVTANVLPSMVFPERQSAFDAGFMAAANDQFGYPPPGMAEDCQQEWLKGWGLGMRNR
jgi:hypothetical protein